MVFRGQEKRALVRQETARVLRSQVEERQGDLGREVRLPGQQRRITLGPVLPNNRESHRCQGPDTRDR
jgi:hypothetical protein